MLARVPAVMLTVFAHRVVSRLRATESILPGPMFIQSRLEKGTKPTLPSRLNR